MEEQSIFESTLSTESNAHILSAAKWSRFIGISFMIISGIMLLAVIAMAFAWEQLADRMSTAFASNPQLAGFENLPGAVLAVVAFLIVVFLVFFSMLFIRVGQHGVNYVHSLDEEAFVKTFGSAKRLFMVYAMFTILGIVISVVSLLGKM